MNLIKEGKTNWKYILIVLVLAVIVGGGIIISQYYYPWGPERPPGFLEGKVTIGPICPVETEGIPCETPPETYEERKIIIYTQNKKSTVSVVDINKEGNYRIALNPGTYVVDINYIGVDFSKDVPKEIEIKTGEIIKLDISIDTGIR